MNKMVHLNVGGTEFVTSRSTLTSVPDCFFSKLVKQEFTVNDIHIFIDRDPTHFRIILNYLRGHKLKKFPLPSNDLTLQELRMEALFFNLPQLVNKIENKRVELSQSQEQFKEQKKSQDTKVEQILEAIDEIYCSFNLGKFTYQKK
ncbi:potassium channel tetramerization domain-containing [Anaeramoeba flamelloides]|uniref:Potassium channel tetramerization domain-containing n=1 Tax=Anaeramoeba flamelloides TaxID=1746091 RepID=A0AAV7Z4V5_9EUKA|nr:potassium channel tetramerization domain-containing [Anaeramoeba flamelloides]